MSDLVFSSGLAPDPNLVFGAGDSAEPDVPVVAVVGGALPIPTLHARVDAVAQVRAVFPLPALTLSARVASVVLVRAGLALPVPTLKARIGYVAQVSANVPLPGLTLQARVVYVAQTSAVIMMPGLELLMTAKYLSNTQRPTVGQTTHDWQVSAAAVSGVTHPEQETGSAPVGWACEWSRAAAASIRAEARMPNTMDRTPTERAGRFSRASPLHQWREAQHQVGTRIWRDRLAPFQAGAKARRGVQMRHQDGDRRARPRRDARHQVTTALCRTYGTDYQSATPFSKGWASRFQDGVPPQAGVSTPPGKPGWPSGPPLYAGAADLLFEFPLGHGGVHLVFGAGDSSDAPGETIIVPIQRVYLVINNVRLYRVSDNAQVPALALSLNLDAESWTWGFSASLPASAQALVEPANGPVELRAMVNGTEFRLLAESIGRERTFGEASIRVSGRGRNAVLAAPYAPVMTFSNPEGRTARQLMDDVLTINGIPLGWTVDWGVTDWNLPAGAFSRQGTWIEALASIAQAAGGYLLPHASAKTLRVRHRYPVAPWEWGTATPDYVLPVDAVARESLRWIEKPAYNRVFVSGQDQGVLGQVTRAGSAGDVLAPMVVDALITEAAAARQRGLAVLGDTGHQIEVSLRLPVLAQTGIVEPGAFIEYQDGSVTRLGLVRSTQIEAGMPEVWQTLGVQGYA